MRYDTSTAVAFFFFFFYVAADFDSYNARPDLSCGVLLAFSAAPLLFRMQESCRTRRAQVTFAWHFPFWCPGFVYSALQWRRAGPAVAREAELEGGKAAGVVVCSKLASFCVQQGVVVRDKPSSCATRRRCARQGAGGHARVCVQQGECAHA